MLSWRTLRTNSSRAVPSLYRRPPRSDPITLTELRFAFLPAAFWHRGQRYQVLNVVAIRDQRRPDGDWRYYRVRCADGQTRTLIHDLIAGHWYLQQEGFRLLPAGVR